MTTMLLLLLASPGHQLVAVETGMVYGDDESVLRWPLVVGEDGDPAVELMNAALDFELITGEPLEAVVENYAGCGRGLVGADFEVNTDCAGILDITIVTEWLGAYPSTSRHYVNLDTETGAVLTPADLFSPGGMPELAALLDDTLQARIAARELAMGEELEPLLTGDTRFDVEDLSSFSILPGGVVFHFDFAFPHAALAAEPDGDILLPYAALSPWIPADSPLAPACGDRSGAAE
jgi:hypothetical protein